MAKLPLKGARLLTGRDHIIARHHKGRTVAGNLADACIYCNGYKGPNISGLDAVTGKLTRLFNPRRHKWSSISATKAAYWSAVPPSGGRQSRCFGSTCLTWSRYARCLWKTGCSSPSFLVSKAQRRNPLRHNFLCAAIPYPNSLSPSCSRPRIATDRFWTFDIRVSTVCCRIFVALRRLGYRSGLTHHFFLRF